MADAPDLAVIDAAGIRLDVDDLKERVARLETALTLVQRDLVAPTASEGADAHDERLAALKAQIGAAESAKVVVVVSEPVQGAGNTGVPMDGPGEPAAAETADTADTAADAPTVATDEPESAVHDGGEKKKRNAMSEADVAEICRLAHLGHSDPEINHALGGRFTPQAVNQRRKKLGLPSVKEARAALEAKAGGALPLDPAPVPALDSTDAAITASPDAGGPADAPQDA